MAYDDYKILGKNIAIVVKLLIFIDRAFFF